MKIWRQIFPFKIHIGFVYCNLKKFICTWFLKKQVWTINLDEQGFWSSSNLVSSLQNSSLNTVNLELHGLKLHRLCRCAISNWVQTNFLFPPKRAFQGLTVDLIFQTWLQINRGREKTDKKIGFISLKFPNSLIWSSLILLYSRVRNTRVGQNNIVGGKNS